MTGGRVLTSGLGFTAAQKCMGQVGTPVEDNWGRPWPSGQAAGRWAGARDVSLSSSVYVSSFPS